MQILDTVVFLWNTVVLISGSWQGGLCSLCCIWTSCCQPYGLAGASVDRTWSPQCSQSLQLGPPGSALSVCLGILSFFLDCCIDLLIPIWKMWGPSITTGWRSPFSSLSTSSSSRSSWWTSSLVSSSSLFRNKENRSTRTVSWTRIR